MSNAQTRLIASAIALLACLLVLIQYLHDDAKTPPSLQRSPTD